MVPCPRRSGWEGRRDRFGLVSGWRLWLVVGLGVWATGLLGAAASAADLPAVAIYPGAAPPLEEMAWYDEAVLDPGKVSDAELAGLKQRGVRCLALVAGEPGPAAAGRLEALGKRGFAGYLFDGRAQASAAAVDALVLEARRRFPQAVIYFRGPGARLPGLGRALSGYVAEGIFTETAGEGDLSPPVVLDDLEGVRRLATLVTLRRRYRFPFIVLERLPVGHREQARGIARTLADQEFIPHVQVGGRGLAISQREPIPRRILALYDSEEEPEVASTVIHRGAAVPLEYFGYALDYVDVRGKLPAGDLASRYAGVVTWFSDDDMPQPRTYEQWVETLVASGVRIAMLGRVGFQPTAGLLARLGIAASGRRLTGPVTIQSAGKLIGYEANPTPVMRGLANWKASGRELEVHLELRDATGQSITPVVTGFWGGMALDPYLVDRGLEGRSNWIVDPFNFFARALDLEPMPVPDFTTENGRRLLFIHIDGDSFHSVAEMPGKFYGAQIIQRDFLEKYPFPTTVSIVEGIISSAGTHPHLASVLEPIARDIFSLPNVELASHGFAHPFDWVRAARGETGISAVTNDPVFLAVPNYKYSATREIVGSMTYINEKLAPKDKIAKVFLWTGAALPGPDAMKEVVEHKFFNMNGGNGELPHDAPKLAMVPSLGRFVDGALQVYAQAHNETVYTNEWHGPFYGFRRVIDMFRFTESPYRLKPINIYYHFYSGTKLAGITALKEIYEFASDQDTMPIVVSEMCTKVEDFHRVKLARRIDGSWEVRNFGSLRTVRLDKRLGWPSLVDSVNVAGVEDVAPGRYVALSGGDAATIVLQSSRPTVPHLVSANAAIVSWQRERETVRFQLRGHMPVELTVGGCAPSGGVSGARVRIDASKRTARLNFSGHDTREVTLSCR